MNPVGYITMVVMVPNYNQGGYTMTQLEELNLLIDKASSIAGSDSKLARLIGAQPQNVSNWRHGSKPCPPEIQALLAHAAGLDPLAELARATVRKFEGEKKGDLLMKALGKASLVTGAALASVGASAHQIFSTIPAATDLIHTASVWMQCILC